MPWLFFLAGLVVGAVTGKTFTAASIAGLLCFSLGQYLQQLGLRHSLSQLSGELEKLKQRLSALEKPIKTVPQSEAAIVVADIVAPADPAATDAAVAQTPVVAAMPAAKIPLAQRIGQIEDVVSDEPQDDVWLSEAAAKTSAEIPDTPVKAPPKKQRSGPSPVVRLISLARDWLIGGNTVLRVGVVLLFLGLAFLLRYASEHSHLPVEFRYLGVAGAAITLLAIGWRLRHRNGAYGLILQGAGIAVLYLTIFAALRLHPLLSSSEAFSLLIAVTICSTILAITQDSLALAAASALGGFAAPILASSGSGDHVALFSYFCLLNCGILAIAWFKAWRLLNVIGFFGTFSIGLAWGMRSYQPELFVSTEPFLIFFFLLYVLVGLLFTRQKLLAAPAVEAVAKEVLLLWKSGKTDYVDGTIMFGPPIVGFGLQCAIVAHIEFGAAFSALALGFFYTLLTRFLTSRVRMHVPLLIETCLALAVIFITLAIPLGLDARWTTAAWAVEGAGIFWLGIRQQRGLARTFALLVQAGAAVSFALSLHHGDDTLLSGSALGAFLLGTSLLFSHRVARLAADEISALERRCIPIFACAGLVALYVIAPLEFALNGTAITWAVAGVVTIIVGLNIGSRSFLLSAFAIQMFGGVMFLLNIDRSADTSGVFASGWQGLITASIIGFALIMGMLTAARNPAVQNDRRLTHALAVVLLFGLALINIALLFVLQWKTVSGVWAFSGLIIVALSLHLQQRASFLLGLLLQIIGGITFLVTREAAFADSTATDIKPFLHADFWAPTALAVAAFIAAWRLQLEAARESIRVFDHARVASLMRIALLWSVGWWALAWFEEVKRFANVALQPHLLLLVASATSALFVAISRRVRWPALATASLLNIPAAVVILLWAYQPYYHPAADWGWIAWPAFAFAHIYILKKLPDLLPQSLNRYAHWIGVWIAVGVLSLEMRYLFIAFTDEYNAWRWLGWAVVPSAYLLFVSSGRHIGFWPFGEHERDYCFVAALPIALLMAIWFWPACALSNGSADPIAYFPVLNPLELGLLIVLFAVSRWCRNQLSENLSIDLDGLVQRVIGLSLLMFLTTTVFRCAYHWANVPYALQSMLDSMLVQASLSIVWTLCALSLMITGNKHARRDVWISGAVLIAVVVAKLFLVELENRGGLERIVSFIGVGVLLLIVGYFAPLPPRKSEGEISEANA